MAKIDLKKELKHLYNASAKKVVEVDVPTMRFIMVDGQGDPNTAEEYQLAVAALFSLAFTIKFIMKKSSEPVDYVVMPLEGLWWADDMSQFSADRKDDWKWTMMIVQPEFVTEKLFHEAVQEVKRKKNPAALHKVRFENYEEGLSAQIMHIGPYADEAGSVDMIHQFIQDNNHKLSGKHHEIYLSDPRRAKPEKMKTIIRQPIKISS